MLYSPIPPQFVYFLFFVPNFLLVFVNLYQFVNMETSVLFWGSEEWI